LLATTKSTRLANVWEPAKGFTQDVRPLGDSRL
jgi:hypothetical protein